MHKNYGYDVFHRVFGEYKMNQLGSFWGPTIAYQVIAKAVIDGVLIIIIFLGTGYFAKNDGFMLMPNSNGMLVSSQSFTLYFQLTITISFCCRVRDVNFMQIEREISTMACFLFSLLLMFIDENLEGIT